MQTATQNIIRAALENDSELSTRERRQFLQTIRTGSWRESEKKPDSPPRLLRRKEIAERLGVSIRAIDYWHQQGILKGVTLPGRSRAIGFPESQIVELIEGKIS